VPLNDESVHVSDILPWFNAAETPDSAAAHLSRSDFGTHGKEEGAAGNAYERRAYRKLRQLKLRVCREDD
jgi:hypothetical protein